MVKWIGFLLLFFSLPLNAGPSSGFQEGLEMIRPHQGDAIKALKSLDDTDHHALKNWYEGYTESPNVSRYYQGDRQTGSSLKEEAIQKAQNDEETAIIREANQNKNKVDPDFVDGAKTGGERIQNEATTLLDGISSELVDCSKPTVCQTEYTERQCTSRPESVRTYCQQKLFVDVVPHDNVTHYPFTVHIETKDHAYAGATIDLTEGKLLWSGPHDARFFLQGRFPQAIVCQNIIGSIIRVQSGNRSTTVDTIRYPTCANHTLEIHVQGRGKVELDIQLDVALLNTTLEYKDRWEDSCAAWEKILHCAKQNEQCVIENETHSVQGTHLFRPCWQKEIGYLCKEEVNHQQNQTTCESLIRQGCQQKASRCLEESSGGCKKYVDTYQCPITHCTDTSILCNHQTYCLDGNCGSSMRKPDPDFGQAVSRLSATFDAAINFNGASIFKGDSKECNKYALNTVNCCSDSGWLLATSHLFQCGSEAVELGKARERGRTVYVGHYKETANLKDIHVFCVFPSKLARIVQEQGRRDQRGIGFGDAKHPDCSGLTPDTLQAIDFGKIDFRDFIADLQNKMTLANTDVLNQKIQEKMKNWANEGRSHD